MMLRKHALVIWVSISLAAIGSIVAVSITLRTDQQISATPKPSEERHAPTALLQALNEDGLKIRNNEQAGVIKMDRGYLLIIPKRPSYSQMSFRILYSLSGDFMADSEVLKTQSGKPSAVDLELMGHKMSIIPWGTDVTRVDFDSGDTGIEIAISDNELPSREQVSRLSFRRNEFGARLKESFDRMDATTRPSTQRAK
jgi:hypothetical protein